MEIRSKPPCRGLSRFANQRVTRDSKRPSGSRLRPEPTRRLVPCTYRGPAIDRDVTAVCRNAGLPTRSPHDRRRSFGRIAYQAGVPLTVIQGIYGHADLARTSYYIGIDHTEQRTGIDQFARAVGFPARKP